MWAVLAALAMPSAGQNLIGSVAGSDTGSPLAGATVVAIQKPGLPGQRPLIYKAAVGTAGQYSATVPAGQYQLCVHGAGVYLDPCLWGGADIASVPSSTAAPTSAVSAPLRLQKGRWFIVRIHDLQGYLAAEAMPSSGVSAFVSGSGMSEFPLPMIYNGGRIRDYGAVLPMNVPFVVVVGSSIVALTDATGAAASPQGTSFQVTPQNVSTPPWFPPSLALMFPPPTAQMIHFYVSGPK
jgi:hypothetical protein